MATSLAMVSAAMADLLGCCCWAVICTVGRAKVSWGSVNASGGDSPVTGLPPAMPLTLRETCVGGAGDGRGEVCVLPKRSGAVAGVMVR